ncbi:MAG: hypothetical protein M3388_06825 [Acidobacteriota bacterium]|nr:hypothetical protein [Acidobacteriota bacterium]
MRIKTILSIIVFIFAFVFSSVFASLFASKSESQLNLGFVGTTSTSCFKNRGNYTADKIALFVQQDIRYGNERDRKLYRINKDFRPPFTDSSFADFAETVSKYADQSGSMEADKLPQDFQIAWLEHMKAWRDYADILNEMKNSSARKMVSEKQLDELETIHSAEITNTWHKVLRIGRSYGAEVY